MKADKFLSVILCFIVLFGVFTISVIAQAATEEGEPDATPVPVQTTEKPSRDPQKGALYGYGDDGASELQYNARYMFEQSVLPRTIYEYEEETIYYINTLNAEIMKNNILGIWEVAAAEVIYNDAKLSGEELDLNDMDGFWAVVDERRPLYGLGDEHIVDVSIEAVDSDTNAIIITLMDTDWVLLSTYIGIAYNEEMGLNIFTLERSADLMGSGTAPYMFCFVNVESRGSFGTIDNDRETFVRSIHSVMNSSE